MASQSELLDLAFLGKHAVIRDASHPHSPHPRPPLPSGLRVKTREITTARQSLRHNDTTTENNAVVDSLPPPLHDAVSADDRADQLAKGDTVAPCDNDDNNDHSNFGTPPPPAAAPTPASQLLLPLMPAMIGPTEICAAEVWSKDPNFMMYCYKITPCTHRTPHDWRVCPWAHPNERAARRCPRQFHYVAVPCANARSGRSCAKGPACEYSHNVTEYWLHPTRYRAEWCSLGLRCNRRLCFFAHSDAELRSVNASATPAAPLLPPLPIVLQPPPPPLPPQVPYLDLLALTSSAQRSQTHSLEQQNHHQHHHQHQSAGSSGLNAPASLDDAKQHEILQLLMTALLPATTTIHSHAVSIDPVLIRRQQQQQHQQQRQQRQSSVSTVPAFCDLLGAVTPPPLASLSQLAPAIPIAGQVYASGATAPTAAPPKYIIDASNVEYIAALLMQNLPTV